MPSNDKSKKSNKRVTSAKQWRRRQEAVAVDLPSGVRCLARRVGMQVFLEMGVIPNYLQPIVNQVIREKQYLPPEQQKEIMEDPKMLLQTAAMMDRALVMTVIEPEVLLPPGCVTCGKYMDFEANDIHNRMSDNYTHDYEQPTRDEDSMYADEVDLMDKVFLFQWSVGGGADLETFRQGFSQSMESLADIEGTGVASE
jgi:hypothetical protein